jgi:hypothetical protein
MPDFAHPPRSCRFPGYRSFVVAGITPLCIVMSRRNRWPADRARRVCEPLQKIRDGSRFVPPVPRWSLVATSRARHRTAKLNAEAFQQKRLANRLSPYQSSCRIAQQKLRIAKLMCKIAERR